MDVATPSGPETDTEPALQPSTPLWVRRLAIALAIVVVIAVGVAAALGGFEQRDDHIRVAPGNEIDARNLVFTLDHATAEPTASGGWTVVVFGQVRNPHSEPIAPIVGDRGNLAVRPAARTHTASVSSFSLGGTWRRTYVPADNRPMAFEATFTLPPTELGDTMDCAVFAMEYTDTTILGLGSGPYWNIDSYARVQYATLPLTVLAAER